MKNTLFFLLGFLCLHLTVYCSARTINSNYSGIAFDNNGTELVIQGLTSTPIELVFPEQAKEVLILVTIYDDTGDILYQEKTHKTDLDYTVLNLPKGEKILMIEVGNACQSIVFE